MNVDRVDGQDNILLAMNSQRQCICLSDDGYWRIKTNQEINDVLKGQNIVGFNKKQRLNWLGHVELKAEDNVVQNIKRWKPANCKT